MNFTAMKLKAPEIDEAFAKVTESLGIVVSTQISSTLHKYRAAIAAVVAALVCVQLGIVLIALGIRDAILSPAPLQAIMGLIGLGCLSILAAVGLLLVFCRPQRS